MVPAQISLEKLVECHWDCCTHVDSLRLNVGMCRHVHAYERMNRVYNYTVDPCGPVHVTVGDGGK